MNGVAWVARGVCIVSYVRDLLFVHGQTRCRPWFVCTARAPGLAPCRET